MVRAKNQVGRALIPSRDIAVGEKIYTILETTVDVQIVWSRKENNDYKGFDLLGHQRHSGSTGWKHTSRASAQATVLNEAKTIFLLPTHAQHAYAWET